ncbi:MAG: hypothetical protein PHD86_06160 [Kiritimatiellae bacterium]|nr:hypothetical protein [Kiritimatiellia bacterium]
MRNVRRHAEKIFMVLFAAALLAAPAFAQDAVYSLNVVGFQKVAAVPTALTLAGNPFESPDPELNSLISTQLTAGASFGAADKILKWDADSQTYVKYYLRNNARAGVVNKWVLSTDEGIPTTNVFLNSDDGFFIQTVASSTQQVVMVGDVVNDPEIQKSIPAALSLHSFPYSAPIAIKDMNMTNATAGASFGASDKLMVWDEAQQQYIKYYFRNNARAGVVNKWVLSTDEGVETTDVINPNDGFWIQALSQFQWVAKRPYTLD